MHREKKPKRKASANVNEHLFGVAFYPQLPLLEVLLFRGFYDDYCFLRYRGRLLRPMQTT